MSEENEYSVSMTQAGLEYLDIKEQLNTAKEENESLTQQNKQLKDLWRIHRGKIYECNCGDYVYDGYCLGCDSKELKEYNAFDLLQQNKQIRENINNIKNLCNENWEDMTVDKFQNQLLQALKGGKQ